MNVTQIKDLVNEVTLEVLGENSVLNEDLSNVVDIGKSIMSSETNREQFMKKLTDRIVRVEIDNREFESRVPGIFRLNYEFGSAREVVDFDLPEATETQDWNLTNEQEYPDNIFYEPSANVKFYDSKTTFTIPISKTDEQLKMAFTSANELYSFIAGIDLAVNNSLKIKKDGLVMRVINSIMGDTIFDEFPTADYTQHSSVKAINLLYEYNQTVTTPLTVSNCLENSAFLAFCAKKVGITASRMKTPSTLFNIGNRPKFTSTSLMHTVLLDEFKKSLDVYLNASTFHEEYVALKDLGDVSEVTCWQGIGTGSTAYDFNQISQINVKTAAGNTVNCTGILATIFDHYACGITQENPRTTANYIRSANFTNEWHKQDCSYFENGNNNCVVFFIA